MEASPLILNMQYSRPVAVIGDIHGCADRLEELLRRLEDLPVLVTGDVCDRGPDTRRVIDMLVERGARGVRGNHEEWLTAWVHRRGFESFALHPVMGGEATLASYGVAGETPRHIEMQWHMVPPEHRAWLADLALVVDLEVMGQRYWMIHAGVPPLSNMEPFSDGEIIGHLVQHDPHSLLWGGTHPHAMARLNQTVIMGHMALERPLDRGHVIGLDTGAGTREGGLLSAVVLPHRRFISVGPGAP